MGSCCSRFRRNKLCEAGTGWCSCHYQFGDRWSKSDFLLEVPQLKFQTQWRAVVSSGSSFFLSSLCFIFECCYNSMSRLLIWFYSFHYSHLVHGPQDIQLDNSRDRLERRDGQSCSRALSSLKVEGISNLLYSALQHYGSDPIRSCLRARSYLMAGSLENGYLQLCLCSRQSLTLLCEEREIAWEICNRQHKNFGKSSSLSTRLPFWFHWHHIHVDKHLMCLEHERNVPDL